MFGYLDGLAEDLLPYVLAIGCVGLCLVGGLVFLIFRLYKVSKQPKRLVIIAVIGSLIILGWSLVLV